MKGLIHKTVKNAVPTNYWKSMSNRKKLMDEIAIKLNITKPSDWGNVPFRIILESGGGSLINFYYKGSLFQCLKSVYSDIEWKKEWFSNLPQFPRLYWNSIENRKKFLDEIATKYNIKEPSDWAKISSNVIREEGGSSLIAHFGGSVFECLQSVYKDIEWKREWFRFPKFYWSIEKSKKVLIEIAKKLKITKPSDWGRITKQEFIDAGGKPLLTFYDESLFSCLKSVLKDIEWKREWFYRYPKFHWDSIENRKKFLDQLTITFKIKEPSDWGKITKQEIYEVGGSSLIRYYDGSLFKCLEALYPDIEWQRSWFPISSRHPNTHFNSIQNRKIALDKIALKLNIKKPSDWGKVTNQMMHSAGGTTLLIYYGGSLFACLQSIYKDIVWQRSWFLNLRKFSKSHWNSIENCQKFMNELAHTSNINGVNDWRKITSAIIRNRGGVGLLRKYENSIKKILQAVYPSKDWSGFFSFKREASEARLRGLLRDVFVNERSISNYRKHNIIYNKNN